MRRISKLVILLIFSFFVSLTFPTYSLGGQIKHKHARHKTHKRHFRHSHRKYYKNRTAHHSQPVKKDYIINNVRRNLGW